MPRSVWVARAIPCLSDWTTTGAWRLVGAARFLHCSKSGLDYFSLTARIFEWEQGVADVSL
jgi:hypothetical protein